MKHSEVEALVLFTKEKHFLNVYMKYIPIKLEYCVSVSPFFYL